MSQDLKRLNQYQTKISAEFDIYVQEMVILLNNDGQYYMTNDVIMYSILVSYKNHLNTVIPIYRNMLFDTVTDFNYRKLSKKVSNDMERIIIQDINDIAASLHNALSLLDIVNSRIRVEGYVKDLKQTKSE